VTGTQSAYRRPNTTYSSFGTRGNRGESQYNSVVFALDTQQLGRTGLALTSRYALSKSEDNLSSTFTDSDNNRSITGSGYLDPWNPGLDYGYSAFDVRHRLSASAIWSIPFGGDNTWAGGWQVKRPVYRAQRFTPSRIGECENAAFVCMRALDPIGISRTANGTAPTGEDNEFILLDLAALEPFAGTYAASVQGTSDFGPWPTTMTRGMTSTVRAPGTWTCSIGKRFRFGTKAALARFEMYNLFNHANMYLNSSSTFVSTPGSNSRVTGFRDDFRRVQLGFKFEF
jgi:hypothetical protein